jgi:Flp pilus assembly protein TadG
VDPERPSTDRRRSDRVEPDRVESDRDNPELGESDRGAAIVDFALVGALLTLLFAAVLQLAVVLHVRNVLVDCAGEGARLGALADRDPDAGAARARELITAELSVRYAQRVSAGRASVDGLPTVEVRVEAPLPVIGLVGAGRVLSVSGHALAEPP